MSTTPEAPPPPPLRQRSGCATAVMVIFGVILLLPGLCVLFFAAEALVQRTFSFSRDVVSLVVIGVLAGFASIGVILIRVAIRGPRP